MEKSLLVTRQIRNPRQDSRMLLATRHSASGQVTQWIKREFSLQGILTGIYQDLMHRAWCTGWQFYLSVHQWDKWRAISEINNELEWVTWVLVNRNEILFLYAIDKSGIEIIPTGNSESGGWKRYEPSDLDNIHHRFGLIVSNLEEKFHDFMGVILMVLGDESNTSRRFCRIIQKYRGKSKQER